MFYVASKEALKRVNGVYHITTVSCQKLLQKLQKDKWRVIDGKVPSLIVNNIPEIVWSKRRVKKLNYPLYVVLDDENVLLLRHKKGGDKR